MNGDAPIVNPVTNQPYDNYDCGPYDECEWLAAKFSSFTGDTSSSASLSRPLRKALKMQLFNNVMWTTIPMPMWGYEDQWLKPGNDATVRIRVQKLLLTLLKQHT